jgi:hypothetical protein
VVAEAAEYSSCRYLYGDLMRGGNDDPANRSVPVSLEEEEKTHWPVLGKAGAWSYSVEAAESEFHSV